MGKGSGGLSSKSLEQGQLANATALTGIAEQQSKNSQQLFQAAFPGFQTAESFYGALASGDPSAIARAISPATQQIAEATAGAKKNIMNNAPAGGEKNLALENADVSQGAQVGQTATQGYLQSFNALAGLAGQGVGQSIGTAGTGISALGAASTGLGNINEQQIQQKGASLGAFGGLAGDVVNGLFSL